MRRAAPAQGRRSCGLKQYWQKCVSAQFDPCGHSGILHSGIPHSGILHSGIPKNRKSVQIATFLRLGTVALPSISNIGVKAQVISRVTTRFRFTGTEKSPQSKKVAKISEFLFLQRANYQDKADPRKLSNECRVETKREAKGSCHPSGSRPSGTPAT